MTNQGEACPTPLTDEEYAVWKANIEAIAEIKAGPWYKREGDGLVSVEHEPEGDPEMTTTIGIQLRLFATIDDCQAQVEALVGALKKWLAAPSDIRDGAIWKRSDGLVAETDTILANLPAEAARKAQAHDEMAAELEALRVERGEHRQHAQDKTAEVERLKLALEGQLSLGAMEQVWGLLQSAYEYHRDVYPHRAPYPKRAACPKCREYLAALAQREPE